jgi:hypothetical protein
MREQHCGFGLGASGTSKLEPSRLNIWIVRLVALLAILAVGAGSFTAKAATASKTIHVSATVIASCNIQPPAQPGMAKNDIHCSQAGDESGATAKPMVTFSHDDEPGVVRETITF